MTDCYRSTFVKYPANSNLVRRTKRNLIKGGPDGSADRKTTIDTARKIFVLPTDSALVAPGFKNL